MDLQQGELEVATTKRHSQVLMPEHEHPKPPSSAAPSCLARVLGLGLPACCGEPWSVAQLQGGIISVPIVEPAAFNIALRLEYRSPGYCRTTITQAIPWMLE